MKIFSKSLYNIEQIKARSIVGKVDGIELFFDCHMKENQDILPYAKDHFNMVSLESMDYIYDGAGLDLMSDRKNVREISRKFIDVMMSLTIKYDLFPFSMHLVSGSVPFKPGDSLDVDLKKGEENLHNIKEYLESAYGSEMDRFCFENCILLDFMGGEYITLCKAGKVFEDTAFINGNSCFDIAHYAINFLICHKAEKEIIKINEKKYPNVIPKRLMNETKKYTKDNLNNYLEDLISRAPSEDIQRFHFSNMFGICPGNCEGYLEGYIDLKRILAVIKRYHPEAVIVPEVTEVDYLNPVKQKKILDFIRNGI